MKKYDIDEHPAHRARCAEENVEVRRVMLDRYGIERYMLDSGAVD